MYKNPKYKSRDRNIKYRHKSPLEKASGPIRKGLKPNGSLLLMGKRVGKTIR